MAAVLFVCTGNICRSPTADGVLRHKLAEAGLSARVSTDSAGTHSYHIGDGPSQLAVECGLEKGYDFADLRARLVTPADFTAFDLILGMDQGHMTRLEKMTPAGATARLDLLLSYAPGAGREVPDPYYGGRAEYEHSLALIESAMPGLMAALQRDYL